MRLQLPETRWTRIVNTIHHRRYFILGIVLILVSLTFRLRYDIKQQERAEARMAAVEAAIKECDCDAP